VLGMELPHRLYPYLPVFFYDPDDKEFQKYPGLMSADGELAQPYIPESVKENAQGLIASYRAKGEALAAEDVTRNVALAVFGAVQDVHGLANKSSPILDQVRATLDP
jgi:hypothetical protein